jgi:hypothetical protein
MWWNHRNKQPCDPGSSHSLDEPSSQMSLHTRRTLRSSGPFPHNAFFEASTRWLDSLASSIVERRHTLHPTTLISDLSPCWKKEYVDHQVSSTSSLHSSSTNKVNRMWVPDSVYVYEIPSRCNSNWAGRCHALTWEGAERMITCEWDTTPCFHRTDPPPLDVIDALTVLRKAPLVRLQF